MLGHSVRESSQWEEEESAEALYINSDEEFKNKIQDELPDIETKDAKKARSLQMRFLFMSACFSANYACITSSLAIASANLGQELSGIQSGTLFTTCTVSALTISTSVVNRMGAKWSLVFGLSCTCAYVTSFLLTTKIPDARYGIAITGSAVGGTACGWLWTAQGVYFARTAERYAKHSGLSVEKSTSWLASVFASFYVGSEVIIRLCASFLYRFGPDTFVYLVFSVISISCPILMSFVPKEPEPLERATSKADNLSVCKRISQALQLLYEDRRLQLVAGFQLAFGFTSSYINLRINGKIAKQAIGRKNIGYLTAAIPATATLLAFPYSKLSGLIGKAPIMVFGSICCLAIACTVTAIRAETLENLHWGIEFIYILAGCSRGVYESTNKAMIADFFPQQKLAAFANVIALFGGGSAIAFYLFPNLNELTSGIILAIISAEAIIGTVIAFAIHKSMLEKDRLVLLHRSAHQ
mmetsp:Transcript_16939/g.25421  ORF Transcript_16939/g.25421 Transcript_16939/m.25421 type:complete len:470 (+) Transcript_16939:66-1475(+)